MLDVQAEQLENVFQLIDCMTVPAHATSRAPRVEKTLNRTLVLRVPTNLSTRTEWHGMHALCGSKMSGLRTRGRVRRSALRSLRRTARIEQECC